MLLGLGAGAIYAALGLGVVLTFRASGVVNFAFGAMAMCAAYVYSDLESRGDLAVLLPGLPTHHHLADDLPFVASFGLAVAAAALLGLVSYVLVFRPLRRASPLAKVVAAVGLMIVLQALVVLRFGSQTRSIRPILPNEPVELLGMTVPRDRLLLAMLVVVVGALLWALDRHTSFGLVTRAAAEHEEGVELLGRSPDRVAALNWTMAGALAGLGGVLMAPITLLDPATYTLLVVPALGAALLGRLSSFGLTVVGGLSLGMAQAGIVRLQSSVEWLPRVGLREGVPFVAIIGVVALAGRLLPARGDLVERRLPQPPEPRRVAAGTAALVAVGAGALMLLDGGYRVALVITMIGALVCLSLVVLTGFVGQISLGQMAFAGFGGFALSKLADGLGVPFPFAPLLAAAAAGLIGLLVGIPALRVRGVNLAVVTLAAALAIDALVFRNPDLTGGFRGSTVPPPHLGGLDLSIGGEGTGDYPRVAFGLLVLVVLAAVAAGVANLRRSGTGRRMLAVRADERAAAATGIDVAATKLVAFALSAFVAGLAGALVAYQHTRVSFASFGVFVSLTVVAVAFIGGITRVSGALVGGLLVPNGLVFTALDRWVGFGRYQALVSGLGLLVAAVMWPDGVSGALARLAGRIPRPERMSRSDRARAASAPAELAPLARSGADLGRSDA